MVGIEFNPASRVGQASTEYGIYAWYYLPQFQQPDVDELLEKMPPMDNDPDKMRESQIRTWIIENYYKKYWLFLDSKTEQQPLHVIHQHLKEEWMNITPTIELNTAVSRKPNISPPLIKRLSADDDLLSEFIRGLGDHRLLGFLSPIYIGMAESGSSSIRDRLQKHLKGLEKKREWETDKLRNRFESDDSLESFATRAALAGISPKELWYATFDVDEHLANIKLPDSLENLLNRLVTPALGSN